MTRSMTIMAAVVAVLVSAASSFGQRNPPDPADVAARCVASMEHVADRTVGGIASATDGTLARIARLDAAGAPDREIIGAGQAGINRVHMTGRFGASRIVRIERHCVRLLIRVGAERDLIMRVRTAAEGFRTNIGDAVQRGTGAIRQAVADAIG